MKLSGVYDSFQNEKGKMMPENAIILPFQWTLPYEKYRECIFYRILKRIAIKMNVLISHLTVQLSISMYERNESTGNKSFNKWN